jgi:hypothetical protein
MRPSSKTLTRTLLGLPVRVIALSLVLMIVLSTPGLILQAGAANTLQPKRRSSQGPAQADSPRPRNVILFYDDFPWRKDPDFQVTGEIVRPLVAHIDQNGKATDWMFDSFIFFSWWLYTNNNPDQKYIDSWVQYIFDGNQIANLDATVGEIKSELKQPDYRMNVFLTVPVPFDADHDKAINASAIHKNIDTLMARWQTLDPVNLRLVGFHWGFTESLLLNAVQEVVPDVANYLHSKGMKLMIAPYRKAYGIQNMHAVGFDYVTVQPDYAWDASNDLSSFSDVNNMITSGYVDGPQFELPLQGDGSLKCCGLDWQLNLKTYFDQASAYNWRTTIATYYYGSGVSLMNRTNDASYRTAYETIYAYVVSTRGA